MSNPAKSRLNDVVFASSDRLRCFCNEPRHLSLARYGKYTPPIFEVVMKNILKNNAILKGYEDRYGFLDNVVDVKAKELQEHYRDAKLSLCELQVLIAYTAQEPPYYSEFGRICYNYCPGSASAELDSWVDLLCHMDVALKKLADSRPLADNGPAGSRRLYRIARIPEKIWEEHFEGKTGSEVFFGAPMSTSTVPQWQFVEHGNPGEKVCLLDFDERISAMAGCLSFMPNPISLFPNEMEWLLPSFVRGKIESISCTSAKQDGTVVKTPRGHDVPRVKISATASLEPSLAMLQLPTCSLLDGAATIGLLTSTADSKSHILECLSDVYTSLVKSLEPKSDTRDVKARLIAAAAAGAAVGGVLAGGWALAPVLGLGYAAATTTGFWVGVGLYESALVLTHLGSRYASQRYIESADEQKKREAEVQTQHAAAELTRKSLDSLADKSFLEEAFKSAQEQQEEYLSESVLGLVAAPLQLVRHYLQRQDDARRQTFLLPQIAVFNRLVAKLLDANLSATDEVTKLFATPFPYSQKPPEPLQSLVGAPHEIWMPAADGTKKAEYAKRAWAKLDALRLVLAATRLIVVLGSPDAGKSNFLEAVFRVETEGVGLDQESCTDYVSAFKHPLNSSRCNAYLIDCPGYGDVEESRNTTVNMLMFATQSFVGTFHGIWVHRAARASKLESDTIFTATRRVISLIVVTHVDERIAQLHSDYIRRAKKTGSFDPKRIDGIKKLKEEERKIMQDVREEVSKKFQGLVGEGDKLPEVVYACLSSTSWLYTEEEEDDEMPQPPRFFQHTRDEVANFFPILTAKQLGNKISGVAGLQEED